MLDSFLFFLLKVTLSAFIVVVFIVIVCSAIIIRIMRWHKQLKLFYVLSVMSTISLNNHNNSNSSEDLDSSDEEGSSYCSACDSISEQGEGSTSGRRRTTAHTNSNSNSNPRGTYLVENFAETGSTGKVVTEDVPPKYDFPPAYHTLFPHQQSNLQFVNELLTSSNNSIQNVPKGSQTLDNKNTSTSATEPETTSQTLEVANKIESDGQSP